MTLVESLSRMSYEESLMLEFFGDRYRAHMPRTGRLLPRLAAALRPDNGQDNSLTSYTKFDK